MSRGLGVPRENRDNLFSRFVTTKTEGLGLGLSISRSIIESHGGRIRAISNGRRGATFAFTLPSAGGSGP